MMLKMLEFLSKDFHFSQNCIYIAQFSFFHIHAETEYFYVLMMLWLNHVSVRVYIGASNEFERSTVYLKVLGE